MISQLPKEMNKPNLNWPATSAWLLMGLPKTGKSRMASTFPSALLIDLEKGADFVECYKYPRDSSTNVTLSMVEEIIDDLIVTTNLPYKTIVLDTIDKLAQLVDAETCNKNHVDAIGSIPHGKGYSESSTRFINILEKLMSLRAKGLSIVLVSHTRNDDGVHSVLLTKSSATYIGGQSDHVCFVYKKGERKVRYCVDMSGLRGGIAGSRHPLLSGIVDCENTYQAIREQFAKAKADYDKKLGKIGGANW